MLLFRIDQWLLFCRYSKLNVKHALYSKAKLWVILCSSTLYKSINPGKVTLKCFL